MSEYTIASTGIQTVWVRKDPAGNLVKTEQTQEERFAHVVPPMAEYEVLVRGFAEPFEMMFDNKPQRKTRLELVIQNEGPGKGKTCTILVGWSIGPKSYLGKVYRATTGENVTQGGEYDITKILGGRFRAMLMPSANVDENGKPRGTNVSWDTFDALNPVGAQPVGAAAPADNAGLWAQ